MSDSNGSFLDMSDLDVGEGSVANHVLISEISDCISHSGSEVHELPGQVHESRSSFKIADLKHQP